MEIKSVVIPINSAWQKAEVEYFVGALRALGSTSVEPKVLEAILSRIPGCTMMWGEFPKVKRTLMNAGQLIIESNGRLSLTSAAQEIADLALKFEITLMPEKDAHLN